MAMRILRQKKEQRRNAKLNEIFDVSLCPAQRWLAVIFSILGKRSIRDWENNCGADCRSVQIVSGIFYLYLLVNISSNDEPFL